MCGICGYAFAPGAARAATVQRMADAMVHRGPDRDGFYEDPDVSLGYRRLSVIDLETGDQPMTNEDESVWLVHNGELYNYKPLRETLKTAGHRFKSESDTEVYVHAYEEWGPDFVQRLDGMYALGLWDKRKRTLLLVRDPIGVKPLYYRVDGASVSFASELKAFLVDPTFRASLNWESLIDYLTFGNLYGPKSFLEGVRRLPPGHVLEAREGGTQVRKYWELGGYGDEIGDLALAAKSYRAALEESVNDQLMTDVPLGSHLSGGMDSSSVAYAASRHLDGLPVFTGAFGDETVDETSYARSVAEAIGAKVHETTIDPRRIPSEFGRIVWHLDEPKGGPGVVPAWFVAELASKHVRVVLAGHGGDELFGGYPAYLWSYYAGSLARPGNGWASDVAVDSLGLRLREEGFGRTVGLPLYSAFCSDLGRYGHEQVFSRRQIARLLRRDRRGRLEGYDPRTYLEEVRSLCASRDPLDRVMFLDAKTYLTSLLENEDRISMAFSLEARVPILGRGPVTLATRIPPGLRMCGGILKFVPKKALGGVLPKEVIHHRKVGFSVPLSGWLRGELSGLVDRNLSSNAVEETGLFDPGSVDALRSAEARTPRGAMRTWAILVVQEWARQFLVQGHGPTAS